MKYSKLQKKIVCGEAEQIVDETIYFHYDGYDANTIMTWLSTSSVLHILKCLIKSKWNKTTIQEKAIRNIDSQKKYEELKQKMIKSGIEARKEVK